MAFGRGLSEPEPDHAEDVATVGRRDRAPALRRGGPGRGALLCDDLRLAIQPEATPLYPHLGHVHQGRRRGDDPNGYQVYTHTISWLPEPLDVRTWTLCPEQGMNVDLYGRSTPLRHGESVTMWGPFEIARPVYERSLRVKAILDSGPGRVPGDQQPREPPGQRLHPRRRRRRPGLRPRPLPADPHRQARLALHRPPGDDAERLRPVRVRQLLADPPTRPRPLPDRGRPPAADPQARLRPLPLPGPCGPERLRTTARVRHRPQTPWLSRTPIDSPHPICSSAVAPSRHWPQPSTRAHVVVPLTLGQWGMTPARLPGTDGRDT